MKIASRPTPQGDQGLIQRLRDILDRHGSTERLGLVSLNAHDVQACIDALSTSRPTEAPRPAPHRLVTGRDRHVVESVSLAHGYYLQDEAPGERTREPEAQRPASETTR